MVDFPLRYVKVPEGILLIGDYEKHNLWLLGTILGKPWTGC